MRFEHHWTVTWAGAKIIEEVLLRKKLSNQTDAFQSLLDFTCYDLKF